MIQLDEAVFFKMFQDTISIIDTLDYLEFRLDYKVKIPLTTRVVVPGLLEQYSAIANVQLNANTYSEIKERIEHRLKSVGALLKTAEDAQRMRGE